MKPVLSLLIAFALLTLAACGAPIASGDASVEPQAQLPNPLVSVDGPSAFEPLGVMIDAPEGAEGVAYVIIANEIAQVGFLLGGRAYTYRAACTDEAIDGVYETFDEQTLNMEADGADWYASVTVRTIGGGAKGALATFSYPPARYTLYTGDSVTASEIGELAVKLAERSCPRPKQTAGTQSGDAADANAGQTASLESGVQAMYPILDSIARTVGVVSGRDWNGADYESLWMALYLMGVNWGGSDPRTAIEADSRIVPRQVMLEWAGALTERFNDLPAAPKDMQSLRYDAERDAYAMALSDTGGLDTRVTGYTDNGDGTYGVTLGGYLGGDEPYGGVDFILIDNPFLGGSAGTPLLEADIPPVETPVFLFTVRSAVAKAGE